MGPTVMQVLQHLEKASANVSWLALAWGGLYLIFFLVYRHETGLEERFRRDGPTLRRDFLSVFAPLYFVPAYLAHVLVATLLVVRLEQVRCVSWGAQYATNRGAGVYPAPAPALPLALIAVAPLLLNLPAAVLLLEHPSFLPSEVARGVLSTALFLSPLATWKQSKVWMGKTARPLFLFVCGGCLCYAAIVTFGMAQKL